MANTVASQYLAGILAAKGSQGGNFIRPGKYLFEVIRLAFEKKFKSDFLVLELKVIESSPVGPVYDGKDKPEKQHAPNAPGSSCSSLIDLRGISGASNVKALGCALAGIDERTCDPAMFAMGGEFDQFLQMASNEDPNAVDAKGKPLAVQPLKGFLIRSETYTRPVKSGPNAGNPFTGHNWKHVSATEGNDAASIAKRLAVPAAK